MKRIISSKIYQTYIYDGPVYRFEEYIGNCKFETTAQTVGEAKRNIQYKIKQSLNLVKNAKIDIDLNYLNVKSSKEQDIIEAQDPIF